MLREQRFYLTDILESCDKIIRYTRSLTLAEFVNDEKTFDATMRNLEIIGEAVKYISKDIIMSYPEIEWRKITGLRNTIIHEYFGIDEDIIWDVVQNKIPFLTDQIQMIKNKELTEND